jgi:hypothetical protein
MAEIDTGRLLGLAELLDSRERVGIGEATDPEKNQYILLSHKDAKYISDTIREIINNASR